VATRETQQPRFEGRRRGDDPEVVWNAVVIGVTGTMAAYRTAAWRYGVELERPRLPRLRGAGESMLREEGSVLAS